MLTVDDIAQNLRALRAQATQDQVEEGRDWYPSVAVLIAETASDAFDYTGDHVPFEVAAGVFAAYSQNASWKGNITMATNYLNGGGLKGLPNVVAEIEAIEEGADPAVALHSSPGQLKRPCFYRNLVGDFQVVTCDRWHLEAAYGRRVKLTEKVRDDVTAATAIVAAEFGESPAECQAVIWCVMRGDGQ